MSLLRKVNVDWMPLIRRAAWRSQVEIVRISPFSHIYVENAPGLYVRNLIEKKILNSLFQAGPAQSTADEMKKHNAREATVWAGNRAKSASCGTLVSFVFQKKRRTLPLHYGCTFSILSSCLWCCSLGVIFPLRFRLDLCLRRNVPSQPGMTTALGRHNTPTP